jgi:pyruvate dehydrogenase E2 component (dihydrolipoamide acetyltransferase)
MIISSFPWEFGREESPMCPIEKEPEFALKPLSPVRKAIAERVSRSFQTIPQFDLHLEVDASAFVGARAALRAEGGEVVPGYNDMLISCLSKTLESHPDLNAHFGDDGIKIFKEINIGFAVATSGGVVLPVIRRANSRSLREIAQESAKLIDLATRNLLRSSLQLHGTFTLSSLGKYGVDSFNAIISPPQVAVLATGAIRKKLCVRDEGIFPFETLHLTLTVDHRAIDGAEAADFLSELGSKIRNFSLTR